MRVIKTCQQKHSRQRIAFPPWKKKNPPAVAQHPRDVSSTLDVRITATCWRLTIVKTELARSQGSSSLNPMPSLRQTAGYAKSLSLSSTRTQALAPLHVYHQYIRSRAAQVGDCTIIPKSLSGIRRHGDSNTSDVLVSWILWYHSEKSVTVDMTWQLQMTGLLGKKPRRPVYFRHQ